MNAAGHSYQVPAARELSMDQARYLIHIDAKRRTVRHVESTGELAQLQALVGGSIELGHAWGTGDVLFVDEAGKLKGRPEGFILLDVPHDEFAGSGVIVGRELYTDDGEFLGTATPRITVEQVIPRVRFAV